MKYFVSWFLVIILIPPVVSQSQYYVLKTEGEIRSASQDRFILLGDTLTQMDEILFSTEKDIVFLLGDDLNRYIIKPESGNNKSVVKDILADRTEVIHRPEDIKSAVDMRYYFRGKHLFLGSETEVKICDEYPITAENYFILSYTYDGFTVNKKVPNTQDGLIMRYEDIYSMDGELIDFSKIEECRLSYYKSTRGEIIEIGRFLPVFPANSRVRSEIELIRKVYQNSPEQEMMSTVACYLVDAYGKLVEADFKQWMNENF